VKGYLTSAGKRDRRDPTRSEGSGSTLARRKASSP